MPSRDDGHELVVLVGDGEFRGFVAQAVDAAVDRAARSLLGNAAVDLEEHFYLVEQWFLGLVVGGAELRRALEHEVLEVVGQAGGLGRIVLAAHLHGDVGLDAGRFGIDAHVDLQSVVERIDAGGEGVALHGFVSVFLTRRTAERQQRDDQKTQIFHIKRSSFGGTKVRIFPVKNKSRRCGSRGGGYHSPLNHSLIAG